MKKVLLVEDNQFIRENTAQILTFDNYLVTQACNGREAIVEALENPPDLILSDIMMPELDGFTMLQELKLNPATCHIPVVFLSARLNMADESYAMSLGAAGYLGKPFNEKKLLKTVGSLLGRHFYRHL